MQSPFEAEGTLSFHPRGFGFVALEGEPGGSAFVAPPDANPFLAGDRVHATVVAQDDGRLTATALRLVARPRGEVFGTVGARDGKPVLRVDKQMANTDWPLLGADGLAEGTIVVAAPEGPRTRLLRVVAPTEASLERLIVRHGLRSNDPASVTEALTHVIPELLGARRDLRDLVTVTIDAPTSMDLDDALSILPASADGGLRVFVSIADVDALVPEGSAVDAEARLRGTSVYLAGRVLPMLPPKLSEDALSLLEGRDRPAITAELRLDPEGNVTSTDLYLSIVRSHARLSYDAVSALLDHGTAEGLSPSVVTSLRWLRTAGARLSAARRGRGGVHLLREEAYVTLDATTREPLRMDARKDGSAHALVERLMVATNEAVARWLVDRGLPGVFRVHDAPEHRRIAELDAFARNAGFEAGFGDSLSPRGLAAFEAQFQGTDASAAMYTVLGRVLGPARYTVFPSIHFGLGAPLYLHFTSPIRRYADLAVHRVVKGFLAGRRDRATGEAHLEALSSEINHATLRATKAENERLRILAARLFAGRVGERLSGTVVAVKPFGFVVQLAGTGAQGTVALEVLPGGASAWTADETVGAVAGPGTRYAIGQPLEVVVVGAIEELGRIELAPTDPRGA